MEIQTIINTFEVVKKDVKKRFSSIMSYSTYIFNRNHGINY